MILMYCKICKDDVITLDCMKNTEICGAFLAHLLGLSDRVIAQVSGVCF